MSQVNAGVNTLYVFHERGFTPFLREHYEPKQPRQLVTKFPKPRSNFRGHGSDSRLASEEQTVLSKPRMMLTVGAPQMMVLSALFVDQYEVETVLNPALVEHQVAFGSAVDIDQRSQLMSSIQPLTPRQVAPTGSAIASTETALSIAAIDASDYNLRFAATQKLGLGCFILPCTPSILLWQVTNHGRIRRSRIRYGGPHQKSFR